MVAARHRIHLTFFAPICNRRYKSVKTVLAETIFVIENRYCAAGHRMPIVVWAA